MLIPGKVQAAKSFLKARQTIISRVRNSGKQRGLIFRPTSISLGLTDSCNNQCKYCSASVGPDGKQSMPITTILELSRQIRTETEFDIVVLTGGEPSTQLETFNFAIDRAAQSALILCIQTNGIMPEGARNAIFNTIMRSTLFGAKLNCLQFNLSYSVSRTEEQTAALLDFIRDFSGRSFNIMLQSIFIEMLRETAESDSEIRQLQEQLGDKLTPFEQNFLAHRKQLDMESYWPLLIGKGKNLRGTPLGNFIRQQKSPLNFNRYRRLEQDDKDIIAVDPAGFVYPSGLYMYMGLYPIGHIDSGSLTQIIENANYDPLSIMIDGGKAEILFKIACELYPEFEGLTEECADPFEVIADILEDHEKALAILDRAADWVIGNG